MSSDIYHVEFWNSYKFNLSHFLAFCSTLARSIRLKTQRSVILPGQTRGPVDLRWMDDQHISLKNERDLYSWMDIPRYKCSLRRLEQRLLRTWRIYETTRPEPRGILLTCLFPLGKIDVIPDLRIQMLK